jgi:hypothetical protein
MEKRYRALRTLGRIYQIIGIIIAIITLLAVIGSCVALAVGGANLGRFGRDLRWGPLGMAEGAIAGIFAGIIGILYGGIAALTLYAIGEGIFVLLAMEENTRATAHLLHQQSTQQPPAPQTEPEPSEER